MKSLGEITLSQTERHMRTGTFDKLPEDRQNAILDASARVFARKGYFQAGIVEICQAAEISNGALYKYFENKQGLFITVARRTMDLMMIAANRMAAGQIGIWDRLRLILGEVLPFVTTYRDYFVVYMDLGSPSMDAFASELSDEFERQSFDFFYKIIEEARGKGEIRKEISTETAAYFIDNNLMLFAFSCVSEHYDRRFHQYFGKGLDRLDAEGKIKMIMRSFRQLLG